MPTGLRARFPLDACKVHQNHQHRITRLHAYCEGGLRVELANETLRCMHTAADTQLLVTFLQQQAPAGPQGGPARPGRPGADEAAQEASAAPPAEVWTIALTCMSGWGRHYAFGALDHPRVDFNQTLLRARGCKSVQAHQAGS